MRTETHSQSQPAVTQSTSKIAVTQSTSIVGTQPASESHAPGFQQLLPAPDMATPGSVALTSQAMGALLINQQPLSTADATRQQFQEATCTHVGANAEPRDSIAELCLCTYILRCGESCAAALAALLFQCSSSIPSRCLAKGIVHATKIFLLHKCMRWQAASWAVVGG